MKTLTYKDNNDPFDAEAPVDTCTVLPCTMRKLCLFSVKTFHQSSCMQRMVHSCFLNMSTKAEKNTQ